MNETTSLILKRYKEVKAEIDKLKQELKPLTAYLKKTGDIPKKGE